MTSVKKPRVELIDIAKAITIFLVIMGHADGNLESPMYRLIIYAFHMPLFFFLAGLSIHPSPVHGLTEWKNYFRKNILALVVPYFIWAFVYAPFDFKNVPFFLYASWNALYTSKTLTSLWYLPAFFLARIITQIVISLLDRIKTSDVASKCALFSIPMFIIGLAAPKLSAGYPWCLDAAFVGAAFILLGIAARKPLLILAQQKGVTLAFVFVISLSLLFCGTYLRGDNLTLMLMCDSKYGNIFWFFANSFSGTMAVLSASMILFRLSREGIRPFGTTAITYTGKHTMGIFLLHKNILQLLIMPAVNSFITGPEALNAFLGACITLPISLLLCAVIEKYVPQLLGQFPIYSE